MCGERNAAHSVRSILLCLISSVGASGIIQKAENIPYRWHRGGDRAYGYCCILSDTSGLSEAKAIVMNTCGSSIVP